LVRRRSGGGFHPGRGERKMSRRSLGSLNLVPLAADPTFEIKRNPTKRV